MRLNFRKTLLAGTALVAVGAFITPTSVQAATLTLTGAATWGTVANGMVATPTAGDDVVMTTNQLTIDGSEVGVTTIGDITSTTGNLEINTDDDAANVAITIGSFTGSGAADINIDTPDASTNRAIAVTFTNDVTTAGALAITNSETGGATTVAMTVGGDLSLTGASAITGGAFAGASTTGLTVTGDSTFTGGMTVTGGANAAAVATLTLNGATNTGAIVLTDGGADTAQLVLSGSSAQTVSGAISGDGDITVDNASGVTFSGAITQTGTMTIEKTAGNSSAEFQNTLSSAAIVLGGDSNAGDVNTITFNTTTQAFTVAGTLNGDTTETDAVVVSGDDILTQSGIWGGGGANLDSLTVSGTATLKNDAAITVTDATGVITIENGATIDSNAAITATTLTVNSGGTLDQGAGTITAAIANSGTINQTGTGAITGNITGAGTLNIDASATYTGNVAASSADIATGKTLTFAGANTYSVTTTSLTGTGALALSNANQTVSGNITATADGDGAITIADGAVTTTITGDIGTSSKKIATLTVSGNTGNTVTTTGNLYINAITLDGTDSLQFLGTSAQTVSGTIDGNGATDGAIVVGDATTTTDVTFAGIIGGTTIGSLTVNDNAKATFNADATFSGAVSADAATIGIAAGSTLSAATQTDADVTTWKIGVDKAGGSAQTNATVAFSGDAVNLAVDTVNFVVEANSAPLTTGASVINNVFTGNAAATIAGATVTDNSYIYGFTLVADTNNVDVTVSFDNSIDSLATTASNQNAGNMLLTTLASSTNTQLNQLQGNLASASTSAAANEVLESVVATVDSGAIVATMGVTNQTASITNTRLAALRNGDAAMTGMSAGNANSGAQFWGQAFGTTADQDRRGGIDGYGADTLGLAVGMETEAISDNAVIGLAFTYANTNVNSKNANRTDTDVDSYQISLYGDYDLDDRTYVSGQLGYSFNNNDTTRYNVGGVSGLTAKGSYDSNQISARIETGRSYEVSKDFALIPSVSASYMNYSADSYTETGAGGASLSVNSDTLNILEFGVGLKASWTNENDDGSILKPTLRVGVRQDVIGDKFVANNTFAGGGAAFKTEGFSPARTTFNGGVGVTYFSTENWDLTANYDAELKSDYLSHSGMLKAAYKF